MARVRVLFEMELDTSVRQEDGTVHGLFTFAYGTDPGQVLERDEMIAYGALSCAISDHMNALAEHVREGAGAAEVVLAPARPESLELQGSRGDA